MASIDGALQEMRGFSRRGLLTSTAVMAAGLAVGSLGPDAGLAADALDVSVSKPLRDPNQKNCRIFEYEICNTSDNPVKVNDFHLSWPTGVDPNPGQPPQPVPDQTLGWAPGRGSVDRDGTRHVGWKAGKTFVLDADDCTAVRLLFCCEKGKRIRMIVAKYKVTLNGNEVQSGDIKVPTCG